MTEISKPCSGAEWKVCCLGSWSYRGRYRGIRLAGPPMTGPWRESAWSRTGQAYLSFRPGCWRGRGERATVHKLSYDSFSLRKGRTRRGLYNLHPFLCASAVKSSLLSKWWWSLCTVCHPIQNLQDPSPHLTWTISLFPGPHACLCIIVKASLKNLLFRFFLSFIFTVT